MNPSPRWLWITAELPGALSTGRLVYSAGLASALAEHVELVMVGLAGGGPCPGAVRSVAVDAAMRPSWMSVTSRLPNLAFACSPDDVRTRVEQLLNEAWDVVVVDHLQSAWALPLVRRCHRGRVVFVTHNHEASVRRDIARSARGLTVRYPMLALDAFKAARLERRALDAADVVTSITADDQRRFQRDAPRAAHVLVTPGWSGDTGRAGPPMSQRPRRVGILGSFEWHVKQENLRGFLPAADRILGAAGVEIVVAGLVPDRLRESLEPELGATRLVGFVESTAEFLDQCRVAIVAEPVGGGFKMKTLDYVFAGVPIAAVKGSIAGLPLVAPESMLEADDAPQLAGAILAIVDDETALTQIGAAARARCQGEFSWTSRAEDVLAAAMPSS